MGTRQIKTALNCQGAYGEPITGEPAPLRIGKAFHNKIQRDWKATAKSEVTCEKSIIKASGCRGRIDVRALDQTTNISGVLEIKATDWEAMSPLAVERNIRRHIRQIWVYVDAELAEGHDVCPGVVFPQLPKDLRLAKAIEEAFEAEGIPVVWDSESLQECKARNTEKGRVD